MVLGCFDRPYGAEAMFPCCPRASPWLFSDVPAGLCSEAPPNDTDHLLAAPVRPQRVGSGLVTDGSHGRQRGALFLPSVPYDGLEAS